MENMKLNITFLLTTLMCMVGANGLAYQAKINGIYYNFSGTQATVTYYSYDSSSNSTAYSGNVVIPSSVTYNGTPYTVTSIDDMAFNNCTSLTSITIPSSVTSIGYHAFYGCSSLESVNIPSSVTIIRRCTFWGCTGLTTVTIPSSVTNIDYGAFQGCTGLTTITIPASVTSIGDYAFESCTSLASVSILPGVTSIGQYAFSNCTSLVSVSIPSSVTSIGFGVLWRSNDLASITVNSDNGVFDSRNDCNAIIETESNTLICGCKNTLIPSSVTTIGTSAFRSCTGLTTITIPSSVANIDSYAFAGTSLEALTISPGVTSIGANSFEGCDGLTSVTIPSGVTSIGRFAFDNCDALTSVIIPSSMTSIGYGAFYYCNNLISVTAMMENPVEIEPGTFMNTNNTLYVPYGCKAAYEAADYWNCFKEIVEMAPPSPAIEFADANVKTLCVANWDTNQDGELSETEAAAVTDLGEVFKGKTDITSFEELQYFTGLEVISQMAFSGCSGLTSITIPNSLTSIGDYAFNGCSGLTSVTIPNSVTSIGYNAFSGCTGLTSVIIPNSVTSISSLAFQNCIGLTSVTIPSSIKSIGTNPFSGCSGLNSVAVDADNSIYDSRNNCNAIVETNSNTLIVGCKKTTIPSSVTVIGYGAFAYCSGITSVTIPFSVSSIAPYAFAFCNGLTSVTIPNSVTSIENNAFRCCSGLTSVTIPNSVTSIDFGAFSECSSLTSVTVGMVIPVKISSSTFSNRANAILYVPTGCKTAYEAADYWKEFKEIVEMDKESNNSLYAADMEALVGTKVVLPIELTNEDEVKLCQFDLRLPEGVTVATKSNGKLDAKLMERAENHSISGRELSNGDYRFVIASLDNDSFTGNEGTLMEITLDLAETMEAGEYTVKVMNGELSVPDGNDLVVVKPADTESKLTVRTYTPGDVNNDGSVSVTDAGCAINYILEMVPSVFVFEAADMNGDNSVSVTDVGLIINYILSEGTTASRQVRKKTMTDAQLSLMPIADGYELLLEDKDDFIGFQFDVELANGAVIDGMRLTGAADSDHLLTYRLLSNGKWRVVCYSPTNSTFAGGEAVLFSISATDDLTISDIRLTTTGFDELRPADLVGTATGIANVEQNMSISVQGRTLSITSERETTLPLYSIDGRIYRNLHLRRGQNTFDGLSAGIYMINNRKVILR